MEAALAIYFIQFAVAGAGLTAGVYLIRRHSQKRADVMNTTFEMSPPHDMTEDHMLDLVQSFVSDLPTFKFLGPAYPVFLEKYGRGSEKKYFITIPHNQHDNLSALIDAKIQGIYLEEVKSEDDVVARTAWQEVEELGMSGLTAPLHIPNVKSVAARIDSKFNILGQDESLVLQWAFVPDRPRRSTPELKDKLTGSMLHAIARIGATGEHAKRNLENLRSSLRGVNSGESRLTKRWWAHDVSGRIRRRAGRPYPIYLNDKEFVALMGWQMDGSGRHRARRLEAHSSIPRDEGVVLASSNHARTRGQLLRIPMSTLSQHQWWIGPTGSGKSALLHVQAEQFARMGLGFAVIEPKGDLARDVLSSIPKSRINDVIYFNPADQEHPIGFNILAGDDPHRTADHVVALFKSKFKDSWGPRLEMILRIAVYTAAEHGLSIFEVIELLSNPEFRRPYVRTLKDAGVKRRWRDVDDSPDGATQSVINKVIQFATNPLMQNIVGQITGGINMRDIIANKKILLVSLDAVAIGEANATILGEMLLDQIWMAARSIKDPDTPFPVIGDEFHKLVETNNDIEDMLAMSRSYKVPIIAAHQYSNQLDRVNKHILPALKNNARTKGVFGQSPEDAGKMAEYFPPMKPIDLQMLGQYEVVVSIMTETGLAPAATGLTFAPPKPTGFGPAALAASRKNFSRPRAAVVAEIASRYKDETQGPELPNIGRVR